MYKNDLYLEGFPKIIFSGPGVCVWCDEKADAWDAWAAV